MRKSTRKKEGENIWSELGFMLVRVKKNRKNDASSLFRRLWKSGGHTAGSWDCWERIISCCHVIRSPAGRSEKINPLRARGMLLTFSRKSRRVATINRAENIDAPQGSVAILTRGCVRLFLSGRRDGGEDDRRIGGEERGGRFVYIFR